MNKKHFLEFTMLQTNKRFCIDPQSIDMIEDNSSHTVIYCNYKPIFIAELYKEVIERIVKLNEI
jgi:uncharacterized protein YlzI (FlbEa/FlbD family)